jgi:DNA-binding transcriptional LysR family regulator
VPDIDFWQFDRWCRDVLPELATFHAACHYKTRKMAGTRLQKEGPSIGRSIVRLESALQEYLCGGSLVDPEEQRGVEATDAGRALVEYSAQVYAARAKLLEQLTALQSGSGVRIAMTHYAWLTYSGELEAAYKKIRQEGTLDFGDRFYGQDRVWEDVEKEVLEGRCDVGIYSFPPSRQKAFPEDQLRIMNWMEEEFVLVLPPDLARKAKNRRMTIYDFSQLVTSLPSVVHYSRGLGFDRTVLIHDYLKRQRVMPRFQGDWLFGVNTIAEIKETLIQKGGMSFLPWPAVEQECKRGSLVAFRLYPHMRPRTIKIISRLHNARPAVKDFLEAAESLAGIREFPG